MFPPDIVLEQYVRGKRFVDLHAHLLGMGDDYFWIDEVMRYHLVQRLKKGKQQLNADDYRFRGPRFPDGDAGRRGEFSWEKRLGMALRQLHFNRETKPVAFVMDRVQNASDDEKKALYEHLLLEDQKKFEVKENFNYKTVSEMLGKYFTCDAVYSLEALNMAFGFPTVDLKTPRRTHQVHMRNVNWKLNYLLKEVVCHYIRFNARNRTLSSVIGVTNYDLAMLLQGANLHALYREQERPSLVLEPRGAALLRKALSEAFCMHSVEYGFTPHFYPRRFVLKDAMYEASLDVLSVLLNHIAGQYDQNGVCYAELSIGASDALNPDVWYYLVNKSFKGSTMLEPANGKKRKSKAKKSADAPENANPDDSKDIPPTPETTNPDDSKDIPPIPETTNPDDSKEIPPGYFGFQKESITACLNNKPAGFFVGFLAGFSRNCKPVGAAPSQEEESGDGYKLELADEDSKALEQLENEFHQFWQQYRPSGASSNENTSSELSDDMIQEMKKYVCGVLHNTTKAEQAVETRFGKKVVRQLEKLEHCIDTPQPAKTVGEQGNMDPDEALKYYLSNYLVGLDAFGDEYAQPWTPLIHPKAIAIAKNVYKNTNSNFGIRIHALERVPEKGVLLSDPPSIPWGATAYHLVTTFESLKKLQTDLDILKQSATRDEPHDPCAATASKRQRKSKPEDSSNQGLSKTQDPPTPSRLRIGHGTYLKRDEGLCDPLRKLLAEMRQWVTEASVVLEVCPTSNHCLVNDTGGGSNNVPDMLRVLMEGMFKDPSKRMLFVLATDDDGIFPIQPCVEHNRHQSVAHEYCVAMNAESSKTWFTGQIAAHHIELLVRIAQQATFQCSNVYREWQWQ